MNIFKSNNCNQDFGRIHSVNCVGVTFAAQEMTFAIRALLVVSAKTMFMAIIAISANRTLIIWRSIIRWDVRNAFVSALPIAAPVLT